MVNCVCFDLHCGLPIYSGLCYSLNNYDPREKLDQGVVVAIANKRGIMLKGEDKKEYQRKYMKTKRSKMLDPQIDGHGI